MSDLRKGLKKSLDSNKIDQPYTSKILKATALLEDTKTVLSYWDDSLSVQDNFQIAKQNNVFGKASRSRIEDILAIFRQRYFDNPSIGLSLSYLLKSGFKSDAIDPLLYYFSVKTDRLLEDTVIEILWPMVQIGQYEITPNIIKKQIEGWVGESKTTTKWSESTIIKVTQHLLATLRDYKILEGAVKKKISPYYLPTESFAYISFYLNINSISGNNLVNAPDWKLFFLTPLTVERFFMEAEQEGLLKYSAAGSIIRIDYPANTLEEYARVIARKKYR